MLHFIRFVLFRPPTTFVRNLLSNSALYSFFSSPSLVRFVLPPIPAPASNWASLISTNSTTDWAYRSPPVSLTLRKRLRSSTRNRATSTVTTKANASERSGDMKPIASSRPTTSNPTALLKTVSPHKLSTNRVHSSSVRAT